MKENLEMTESAVLAFVLDDMQFLGLIELNRMKTKPLRLKLSRKTRKHE